jgi:hypothetical protein
MPNSNAKPTAKPAPALVSKGSSQRKAIEEAKKKQLAATMTKIKAHRQGKHDASEEEVLDFALSLISKNGANEDEDESDPFSLNRFLKASFGETLARDRRETWLEQNEKRLRSVAKRQAPTDDERALARLALKNTISLLQSVDEDGGSFKLDRWEALVRELTQAGLLPAEAWSPVAQEAIASSKGVAGAGSERALRALGFIVKETPGGLGALRFTHEGEDGWPVVAWSCASNNPGPKALFAVALGAPGVDPWARSPKGHTALMGAAARGDMKQVGALLRQKGAKNSVNAKTQEGATALMLAAQRNQADAVRALLAGGADANVKMPEPHSGFTALNYAIDRGHVKCVEALARATDPKLKDDLGRSAMEHAMQEGKWDCADALFPHCLDGGAQNAILAFARAQLPRLAALAEAEALRGAAGVSARQKSEKKTPEPCEDSPGAQEAAASAGGENNGAQNAGASGAGDADATARERSRGMRL